jgi:hypothetical protein
VAEVFGHRSHQQQRMNWIDAVKQDIKHLHLMQEDAADWIKQRIQVADCRQSE